MKELMWVMKNAALDVWEARGATARRWLRVAAWSMALAAGGMLSHAVWEMTVFLDAGRAPAGERRVGLSHARVESCERELSGLPRELRAGEGFFQSHQTLLACRKEAGGAEFVERREVGPGLRPRGSFADQAKSDPRWLGFERLDALGWSKTPPRASLRGLAENLGWAELTRASRGLESSTMLAERGAGHEWWWRALIGLPNAVGLLAWLALDQGMTALLSLAAGLIGAAALEILWAAQKIKRPEERGRAMRRLGGAALAGVVVLWGVGPPLGAAGLMAHERFEAAVFKPEDRAPVGARLAKLDQCDARLAEAKRLWVLRGVGCREIDGEMALVARSTRSESAELVGMAERALGVKGLAWSSFKSREEGLDLRAFAEMAGWAPATSVSTAWGLSPPRVWESSGDWGARWKSMAPRLAFGLMLMALIGALCVVAGALWRVARVKRAALGESVRGLTRRWTEDAEFVSRAQRRELEKVARRAGGSGGSNSERGRSRL